MKSDCLGCAVLLCLVCLTLLASFFLPSHLSFKNMYIHFSRKAGKLCTCTHSGNHALSRMGLGMRLDTSMLYRPVTAVFIEPLALPELNHSMH